MSTCGLLFQWASTIKIQLSVLIYGSTKRTSSSSFHRNGACFRYNIALLKIAHLSLNNIHSLILCHDIFMYLHSTLYYTLYSAYSKTLIFVSYISCIFFLYIIATRRFCSWKTKAWIKCSSPCKCWERLCEQCGTIIW